MKAPAMDNTQETLTIVSWIKVLQQPADSCHDSPDGYQDLQVSTADAGAGMFYLLKTDRWAFDCIDEIVEQLKLAGVPQSKPKDD